MLSTRQAFLLLLGALLALWLFVTGVVHLIVRPPVSRFGTATSPTA